MVQGQQNDTFDNGIPQYVELTKHRCRSYSVISSFDSYDEDIGDDDEYFWTRSQSSKDSHKSVSLYPQPTMKKRRQDQDPSQVVVCMNETIRNIVNDDISWSQIRQTIKDAKVITSLGVHEACVEYINSKVEEFRHQEEREKEDVRLLRQKQQHPSMSGLNELRKRLSSRSLSIFASRKATTTTPLQKVGSANYEWGVVRHAASTLNTPFYRAGKDLQKELI